MKTLIRILLVTMVFQNLLILSSCWNYREIDQLSVVVGAAVDKGIHEKYSLTVEIVEVSGSKETEMKSKTLTIEGKTIFDAARNAVSFTGDRLYWSHAQIIIISQEIAKEGIVEVVDWFSRDAETRGDIHILVSREKTAKDVLSAKGATELVTSFEIHSTLKNQKSLAKAPESEMWKLTDAMKAKGVGVIVTAVGLNDIDGEKSPRVSGTAIFKADKLVGFLDAEDTTGLLFVRDEVKGGLIVKDRGSGSDDMNISLEIFKTETKVKPVIMDGNVEMNVEIKTTVAVDEIGGTENVIKDEVQVKKLEETVGEILKKRSEDIIRKVQEKFGVDVFRFGDKLRRDEPKVWDKVSGEWADRFKKLKVQVEAKVHIKNSAMLAEPLEVVE